MSKSSNWLSFSDLMTGLMVIFMFVAISYIMEVEKAQESMRYAIVDYQDTKVAIKNKLQSAFEREFKEWDMELGEDLSIRFTNPNVMFAIGKSEITPYFKSVLDQFLPRYFNILLDEDFTDKIKEIRIEGHTDDAPLRLDAQDHEGYMGNIFLSQERAANVLYHFRKMGYFKNLPTIQKEKLQYWITANGLSYGRTLDDNKQETYSTGLPINRKNSRRVEFRIITTSEAVVEEIIKEMIEE